MNSDAIGYAHSMLSPRATPPTPLILDRWNRIWLAPCAAESKKADDPADEFATLRLRHQIRVQRLVVAGIPWETIVAGNLDSPLRHPSDFDRSLCLALERRRSRIGRIKGKIKKIVKSTKVRRKK